MTTWHTIFKSLWYVMYVSSLKYGDLFTFTAKFDMLVVSSKWCKLAGGRRKNPDSLLLILCHTILCCTVHLQQTTLISDDRRNRVKFYLRFYYHLNLIEIYQNFGNISIPHVVLCCSWQLGIKVYSHIFICKFNEILLGYSNRI